MDPARRQVPRVAGGAIARRRRVRKKNAFLPPRPKKPPTGYGLFLREYWDRNRGGQGDGVDMMRRASQEWQNLTQNQKNRFITQTQAGRQAYLREMHVWSAQRAALRRPPSAYGFFLKAVWNRERLSGRNVGEMGTYASNLWKAMSQAEQQPYRDLQVAQSQRYQEEIQKLRTGRGLLDLNWRDDVDAQFGAVNPLPPDNAVDPLQEEDSDDEFVADSDGEEEGDADDEIVADSDGEEEEDLQGMLLG